MERMFSKEDVVEMLRSIKVKNMNHMQVTMDNAIDEVISSYGLNEVRNVNNASYNAIDPVTKKLKE